MAARCSGPGGPASRASGEADTSTVDLVRHAYRQFCGVVTASEDFVSAGAYREAAACTQIAARHAFTTHSGVFASDRLEKVLLRLGCEALPKDPVPRDPQVRTHHTIHVLTHARDKGGDTRFVWRWITADRGRRHSVVITRQGTLEIPPALIDAVSSAGGQIHRIDRPASDILGQASDLRAVLARGDVVALHVFADDVTPTIALGRRGLTARVIYVHHADHTFWVGRRVSHVIAQLRDTPDFPLYDRRGIEPSHTAPLPIPLIPPPQILPRAEAKHALGYAAHQRVLLSIATAFKFDTTVGPHLLDLVTPVLERHPEAVYVAMGPHPVDAWAAAAAATSGRIVALGPRHDTALYYAAADVYLDSYPFASITSLLEAGLHATPLLVYGPPSEANALLSAGAPGLTRSAIGAATSADYMATLERLITDDDYRLSLGPLTRQAILSEHVGNGWMRQLENVYRCAAAFNLPEEAPGTVEEMHVGELDQRVHRLMRPLTLPVGALTDVYAGPLPYLSRLRCLRRLMPLDSTCSLSLFLPPALERLLAGRLSKLGTWIRRFTGSPAHAPETAS